MTTIQDLNRVVMCFGLLMFVFGSSKAWAVVPYSVTPEQADAQQTQVEKQEVIKRIETIKKQDVKVVKEIRNELNQIVGMNSESRPKDEPCAERH